MSEEFKTTVDALVSFDRERIKLKKELTAYKDIARKLAEALQWHERNDHMNNGPLSPYEKSDLLKEYEQLSQDNSGEKE